MRTAHPTLDGLSRIELARAAIGILAAAGDPVQGTEKLTCAGSGDNEGLTAILVADRAARSFEGLIFKREVPPQPELPTG